MRPIISCNVSGGPPYSTVAQSATNPYPNPLAANLNTTVKYLLSQSFAPSTSVTYRRARALYELLCVQRGQNMPSYPLGIQDAILFIAYLFQRNMAASTIATYVAAMATINRLHGGADIFNLFIVKKLLTGVHRIRSSVDTRLPIQLNLLHALVESIPHVVPTPFMQALLKAAYLVCLHAFLRVGEIAAKSASDTIRPLQLQDVALQPPVNPSSCLITLRQSKNSTSSQSIHLTKRLHLPTAFCPVAAIAKYRLLRGSQEGMFFILGCKRPLTKCVFNTLLARSISWVGLDPSRYKAHSFRIGAATTAALQGVSDEKIQLLGRWKSGAFRKYIRIPQLSNV